MRVMPAAIPEVLLVQPDVFADPRGAKTSAGSDGTLGPRNTPSSMNAAFLSEQFWDGRAATLEEQAALPFVNPIEMGIADAAALEKLVASQPDYAPLFQAAFGLRSRRTSGSGRNRVRSTPFGVSTVRTPG